jgi:uncharacterized membrane protein YphA (DoxX/SURF4 family)
MVETQTAPPAPPNRSTLAGSSVPFWMLRASLGAVFFWFGALKLAGYSPVFDLLQRAYGNLVTKPAYLALALFEIGLGILLCAGLVRRWAATAAALHLTGTLTLVVVAPALIFAPSFPVLTLTGEFLAKNLVLIAAAVALVFDSAGAAHERRRGRVDGRPLGRPIAKNSVFFKSSLFFGRRRRSPSAFGASVGSVNRTAPWGWFRIAQSRLPWATTMERLIPSTMLMPLGLVV